MRRLVPGMLLASVASVALALLSLTPAGAATQMAPGSVSSSPADTPELYGSDSPPQQVRQLVQCGDTMYAVGHISEINHNGTTYNVSNVFSFQATSPYTVSSWAPVVNGTVDTITFSGGNCADAYIGGKFSAVNGTKVANIAEIDTTTGNVVPGFGHTANGEVETLLGVAGHILAGGAFTSINGSTADPYMASLNPATGTDDGFVALNISGDYQYPCSGAGCNNGESSPNHTMVYNQALSHGGTLDLVMGDFTSVGGLGRQQIFMLNLGTSPASVTAWTSPEWDGSDGMQFPGQSTGYPYECAGVESFYIRAAAWSPDDQTIYLGDTGYHPNEWPVGATQRTGLCDAAAAFPATQGVVYHNWVNYTGCDSLYSAAADATTAYFGGHERWSSNPNDCDAAGTGAISAPGFEGLSVTDGSLTLNPTRARGLGADDMLLTSAGLWIASDNQNNANQCGGIFGHAGICFLPYATSSVTVNNPGNQTSAAGSPVSLQIQATDSAGLTLSYAATGLPAGLSIDSSNGQITGTPTGGGTSNVTVTATDSAGDIGSTSFTWTITSQPPVATVAVGVEGTDGQMWVQAPQLGGGWHPLGGKISGPPAVAAAPNANGATPASPLFAATGTNSILYVRSVSAGWQPVGPGLGHCVGTPALVVTGTAAPYTVTVACDGTDHALWERSGTWSGSGLPTFGSGWKNLGGVLAAGPAVAPVGTTMTFFALGTNRHIYTRTASTGYAQMAWQCSGSPAAAQQAPGGATTFVCHGSGNALWEAVNAGSGWSTPVSLGGSLIGGPGLALTSSVAEFFAEGTNHAVFYRTPATGWITLGGKVVGGVGAAPLN